MGTCYAAVDEDGAEWIYAEEPDRRILAGIWYVGEGFVELPKGSIEKLIGKKITWEDEPVELKEER